MLALTVTVGIALGVFGSRILNAHQEPVKRTTLLKDDLAGIEGKEAHVRITEIAPGATSPKHYHPGHVFRYVLEGSVLFEAEGQPAVTRAAGEAFHEPPNRSTALRMPVRQFRSKSWRSRSSRRDSPTRSR